MKKSFGKLVADEEIQNTAIQNLEEWSTVEKLAVYRPYINHLVQQKNYEVLLDKEGKAQLKAAFRALAKKFHPDLVMDHGEKERREEIMAEVNQAYAASDLKALEKLLEQPEVVSGQPTRTREDVLRHLSEEIRRLNKVIAGLEKTLSDLTNSSTLKLMLDVSMARNEGRDLLAEMAEDYRLEIAQVENELAELQ